MAPRETGAPWRHFLLFGLAAGALHFSLPTGTGSQSLVYVGIGLASAVAVLAGVRLHRPARPLPWILFALGQLALTAGDAIWIWQDLVIHIESPFPSIADVVYLLSYPLWAAGLFLLVRDRTSGRAVARIVDPLIVTAGAGIVAWVFLMAPYARDHSLTLTEELTSLAYPVGDLLLLSMTLRLLFASGRRSPAHMLLLSSLTCALVADAVYGRLVLADSYLSGHWIDGVWLVGYVLWGAAALHPSMRRASSPDADPLRGSVVGRMLLLAVGSLAAPVVLVLRSASGIHGEEVLIGTGAVVLFVLVLIRVGDLLSAMRALAVRLSKQSDELQEALRTGDELRERQEQFTTFASHELRAPITGVLASLVTLRRLMDFPGTDAERTEMLDTASRQARRLGRLVEDLLAVSHPGDEIDVHLVPLSVIQSLEEVLDELGQAARGRVHAEIQPGTIVLADHDRLAQALTNLVNGALERAPEVLRITARESHGSVEIAARGTAGAVEPIINYEGEIDWDLLGISMHALRALVEAMNGSVRAVVETDGSATFSFTLAAAVKVAPEAARARAAS